MFSLIDSSRGPAGTTGLRASSAAALRRPVLCASASTAASTASEELCCGAVTVTVGSASIQIDGLAHVARGGTSLYPYTVSPGAMFRVLLDIGMLSD